MQPHFDRGYTGHSLSRCSEANREAHGRVGLINMKVPSKREQSQAGLGYAEREVLGGEASTYGRVYDPYLQRFLSPDPYVQAPHNAQNYNRYTYALNNPLMYTDPSGYNWVSDVWKWTKDNIVKPPLRIVAIAVAIVYCGASVAVGIIVGTAVGTAIAGPIGGTVGGWAGGIVFGTAGGLTALWAMDKFDEWYFSW